MSTRRILTLVLRTLALIAGFIVVIVALTLVFDRVARASGMTWLDNLSPTWFVVLLFLLVPSRYRALPIRWRIVGSAVIAAPIEQIWPRLVPRPGNPYHESTITRIEAAPGAPDRLFLHFDKELADPGQADPPVLETVIVQETYGKRVLLRHQNAETMPLLGRDLVMSETLVEPVEGGKHRVTFIEHMRAFRLSSLLVFLHLNPCQDGAERLKALCEGTPDTSWMGTTMTELRQGPAGGTSTGTRELVVAGIIVANILVVFTLLLVWSIAGTATP